MLKPYPREFRDEVVAVARKHEAPLKQIAREIRCPGLMSGRTSWGHQNSSL
jgi:transposase-like protein